MVAMQFPQPRCSCWSGSAQPPPLQRNLLMISTDGEIAERMLCQIAPSNPKITAKRANTGNPTPDSVRFAFFFWDPQCATVLKCASLQDTCCNTERGKKPRRELEKCVWFGTCASAFYYIYTYIYTIHNKWANSGLRSRPTSRTQTQLAVLHLHHRFL